MSDARHKSKKFLRMCDVRHTSKKFLTDFIEIYRSHPALWKVKSNEYLNRNLRQLGYDALVEHYRQIDEEVDRDFVTKKIQSLRSSFRKELKKVEKCNESGSDKQYVPKLWYFDLLMFTRNHETPTDSIDTLSKSYTEGTRRNNGATEVENAKIETTFKTPAKVVNEKLTPHEIQPQIFMTNCTSTLKRDAAEGSDSTAFGQFIASKHVKLNETQKMYAETLITKILHKAILNNLTEDTIICDSHQLVWTPPPLTSFSPATTPSPTAEHDQNKEQPRNTGTDFSRSSLHEHHSNSKKQSRTIRAKTRTANKSSCP